MLTMYNADADMHGVIESHYCLLAMCETEILMISSNLTFVLKTGTDTRVIESGS